MVDPSAPVLDLLDQAGAAARAVKGNFHCRIRTFEPSLRSVTEQEYRILSDFQRGLRDHELSFFLQPQCDAVTGKVVGAESLARWRLPNGAYLSPGVFIPVLEKYGFVTELDRYVWEEVCRWLRNWLDAGRTAVPVSVNVSRIDLITLDVPAFLDELIQRYALPRELLKIEITESAFVNDDTIVQNAANRFRELGFTILMDDFGTGYSSLSMLRNLNVDIVKLDAGFLHFSQGDSEKALRIVETIVNMTKTMGVPVVVEGVEKQEQVEYLTELGCRYIQGFYFYRPMPVDQFEELIGSENKILKEGISFHANQEISIREFLNQNIYSDSMLNNVLGPVAFYEWDGNENVDIVRFNEAFTRVVDDPGFDERIQGTQMFCHPDDTEAYINLFRHADLHRNSGASGVIGVYRGDGSLGQFLMRIYYFDETDKGKVYYGSLQEVTDYTRLQTEMQLLRGFSSDTVIFMSRSLEEWLFEVIIHGLEETLGVDQDTLEEALNSGNYLKRLEPDFPRQMDKLLSTAETEGISVMHFNFTCENGEKIALFAKADRVRDEHSDVKFILTLNRTVTAL
jgi:EAL domain-containing protein (putative c-di-GMP-specific phosphodiesterase class I)